MMARLVTAIAAKPEVCFDAARDMDLHVASQRRAGEQAVGGVTSGLIGNGEEVVFEARHFGVRWRATFRIIEFQRPHRFVDEMVRGVLPFFRHEHRFEPTRVGTDMIDEITYRLPFGPLGALFDRIAFRTHIQQLLVERARHLKAAVEGSRQERNPSRSNR